MNVGAGKVLPLSSIVHWLAKKSFSISALCRTFEMKTSFSIRGGMFVCFLELIILLYTIQKLFCPVLGSESFFPRDVKYDFLSLLGKFIGTFLDITHILVFSSISATLDPFTIYPRVTFDSSLKR